MAYHDSTTANGNDSAPTVAVPNGGGASPLAADDIVLLILTYDNSGGAVDAGEMPTGFTELAEVDNSLDGQTTWIGWKRLTGADTGNYAFTNGISSDGTAAQVNNWALCAIAFRGRDTTNPPVQSSNASSNASNASPVTITANGVTAVDGDDLCWLAAADVNASGIANVFTAPSSPAFTSQETAENGFSFAMVASRDNVSAGATGTIAGTLTLTSGATGWVAWTVRIPAAAGGGGAVLRKNSLLRVFVGR